MAEKIKLLQIAPRFPFPMDDGGKIGIANIYKEFSRQGADVTFFTFDEPNPDGSLIPDDAIKEADSFGKLIMQKHSTKNTKSRIIKSFLYNNSIYIAKHQSQEAMKRLCKLTEECKFDIIHADHSCMAPYAIQLKKKHNIPIGIRLHNIEWMIWQRYAESLPVINPKRIYIQSQANLLRNEEKKYFDKFDVCFAITEDDKKIALDMTPNANVLIASAGVNSEEWSPVPEIQRDNNELVIATLFKWVHNIDALVWFINEVLPIIKEKIPDIKLTLIGKYMQNWLHEYKSQGVNPVGYVDKVQPYYNRANVYIAPLFVGGGIRIKILEAMAMELPVVATPIAAEGIKASAEDGLIIVNSIEEYADSVIDLCLNPEKARALGKKARQRIISEYSWEKNVSIMMDSYKHLVNERKLK